MLGVVAVGLFLSGVTVWPMVPQLEFLIAVVWGDWEPTHVYHRLFVDVLAAIRDADARYPFLFYGYDWLAFAHICLAIQFAGAIRDPLRNRWVVESGLIMCALIPLLAGICIPLRGLPWQWFFIDFAFAPGAGIPLWIAWLDIRRAERPTHPKT